MYWLGQSLNSVALRHHSKHALSRGRLPGLHRGRLRRCCHSRHRRPQWRVRCQHTKVAMPVRAWWPHQGSAVFAQPLHGKGWPGAVAQQPLQCCAVVRLNAHICPGPCRNRSQRNRDHSRPSGLARSHAQRCRIPDICETLGSRRRSVCGVWWSSWASNWPALASSIQVSKCSLMVWYSRVRSGWRGL